MMINHRAASEQYLADRIPGGIGDGDPPDDTDVGDLCRLHKLASSRCGLAVRARDGASRERLKCDRQSRNGSLACSKALAPFLIRHAAPKRGGSNVIF